tara:strand:+ start:9104 stop:10447 length:1344 start_codon:yes stop_codon:yes gene_type:complete
MVKKNNLKSFLPAPFTIAVLLTFVTILLALFITEPKQKGSYFLQILDFWEQGIWNSKLLEFAIQMMLMLVLGHTLALSRPIENLISKILKYCSNTSTSAAIITFSTILVSFFNWGLGLVFGAIFARKVGEYASKNSIKLNYPLIGAAGYSGMMVWHGGISGSAPIKIAEEGHFLAEQIGIISQKDTIFSTMNITISILLIIILPLAMYFIGKKSKDQIINVSAKKIEKSEKNQKYGIEKLDHSKMLASIFGGIIICFIIYKTFILPQYTSLSIITPNYINFLLLGLCILMHQTFYNFLKSIQQSIGGTSGILIQFPLYFGIMGIMTESGLVEIMSDFFVSISDEKTFPILTFLSAGIVNIFVPSGGGQWAIQGPIIVEAIKASSFNINIEKSVMALAYGDQITNMLQPFWALPLLAITDLKAKEILPYTLVLLFIGTLIFVSGLLLF